MWTRTADSFWEAVYDFWLGEIDPLRYLCLCWPCPVFALGEMCYLPHVFISFFPVLGYMHCLLHFLIVGNMGQAICFLVLKYPVGVITIMVNNEILFIGAT